MTENSAASNQLRNRELAAIHTARRALGLSSEDYRDLLEEWTGKRSAGQLSTRERRYVLDTFRKMGFERLEKRVSVTDADRPQAAKIKVYWLKLHQLGLVKNASPFALNAFVKRMTKVDSISWLTPDQANIVIEALKSWVERHEAKAGRA